MTEETPEKTPEETEAEKRHQKRMRNKAEKRRLQKCGTIHKTFYPNRAARRKAEKVLHKKNPSVDDFIFYKRFASCAARLPNNDSGYISKKKRKAA